MNISQTQPKNVVLIGGGHAHALVLHAWTKAPIDANVTVINPAPTAPYTGMLPGFIAGHYKREELDYDLVRLAELAGAHLVLGKATDIEREAKTITVDGDSTLPYDVCSINIGITSAIPTLPGFEEHGVPAKPLGLLATKWTEFVDAWENRNTQQPRIVVIGGGVGGCELAMAMSFRLRQQRHDPAITVIDRTHILDGTSDITRTQLRKELLDVDVDIRENTEVELVGEDHVVVSANDTRETIPADFVVGAAGAYPFPWLSNLGLATTNGFLDVRETLQTTVDPTVFAAGDCAHLAYNPRPKAGVFAVREAPYLAKNIQALLTGGHLDEYDPQVDYLKLISLGRKSAGADKFGRFNKGPQMWRLKDRIDRKFMNSLDESPDK